MENDLIRRGDALNVIEHTGNAMSGWLWEELHEDIQALPAVDAAEVVACAECKHSDTYPDGADNDMPLKCLSIRYGGVYPDWFCEHGQRREDGDA